MNITVKTLGEGSPILAGHSGLKKVIKSAQILAPDLSFHMGKRGWASHAVHIRPSQEAYLCSLQRSKRSQLAQIIVEQRPACIVLSSAKTCKELLLRADAANIPVIKTGNMQRLSRILVEKLSSQISLHGVLVQVFEVGTLIIGKSAVGKSETALDLVLRGHKLVADDLVVIEKAGKELTGRPVSLGAGLLQIRGLGIIDIRALYGESATLGSSRIGMVIELEEWQPGEHGVLVGLREQRYRLLGGSLPYLKLAVKQGRNMATLIEVAVRNQKLKHQGIYTAREVEKKLRKKLME